MRWNTEGINVTVVQIGSVDTTFFDTELANRPGEVVVSIGGPPEFNLWTEVRTHGVWIAVQVVMSGLALASGSMSVAKLIAYVRYRGRPEFSVPQICLTFEIAANMCTYITIY
jgi:hypothetical protein